MKAEQTWRAVLGELEMQMSQASFSTWLRDSKLIAFEDNIFVVGVESGFIKDWLDGRMRSTVERTLAGIVGQETSVSFVVWPEPAAPGPSSKLNLPDRAEETSPTQIVSSKRFLSLENFVSGPENLLALAASQTISEQLHPTQSPLFIYGDIGLGKTHLLSGIKHACDTKGLRAHMMTAEGFTNELVSSIKAGEGDLFRDKYRQCDILLIDDIQFFLGKKSSAEELVLSLIHISEPTRPY